MSCNPNRLVQQSYDSIAKTYQQWTRDKPTPRLKYLDKLLALLPNTSEAKVLELGCGAGDQTIILASRCGHVVANDISEAQINIAKTNVSESNVMFERVDMTSLTFEKSSLQGIVAFYSIIHLAQDDQRLMFTRIFEWLSAGGIFVCNLGARPDPGAAREWLGTQMYWSSFGSGTYLAILEEVGFEIVESEIVDDDEDGKKVPFLWLVVRKPSDPEYLA
jgi:ubiquinone/menaquinone biosynthesis C-methylase UbiE